MVDIIIGSIEPITPSTQQLKPDGTPVEAELLHIREPRQRVIGPLGQERRRQPRQDPQRGRVITLLIPNGTSLPKDLDIRKYKVLLRFMKK
ncbi:MAG: hypothetical protein PHI97_13770 [Desulfobulbus sp.]|nr:hypothetical protein [Desulfobulbus sp.]